MARPQRRQSISGVAVLLMASVAALCLSAAGLSFSTPGSASSSSALRGTASYADATATEAATASSGRFEGSMGVLCLGAAAAMLSHRKRSIRPKRSIVLKAEGDEKKRLEELKVGDKYTGTVVRDATIGVYVDIGAEKDALLPRNQVPQGKKYKKGDTIADIIIYEVSVGSTPSERKIRVAIGQLPSSFKVGDKVKGKVSTVMKDFGVLFDVGGTRDALCPNKMLTKRKDEYKKGEEVELTIVSIDGDKVTVNAGGISQEEAMQKPKRTIESLKVGETVDGTVSTINQQFGVFFDIGTERNALCYTNQLSKSLEEYKEGDTVTGLTIFKVNKEKSQVEVTTRSLSSNLKVGDKVEGEVKSVSQVGVFFDIGYASDALATEQMLSKPISDYTRGEVADLIVMNVSGDRVSVSTKSEEEIGTPLGKLLRGSEVVGKVTSVKENMGIFLDIGAAKEALWRIRGADASALPKPIQEYKKGEEVTGLIITKLDQATQTLEVGSLSMTLPSSSSASLSSLEVGMTVKGTVSRSMDFGVFVDIGAERDALYAASQLEKNFSDYKPGDVLEGLKITEVDTKRQRLAVSMRKCASDFSVGDSVDGKVTKVMPFGIFMDIGASVEALAPSGRLEKEPTEYAVGEELPGLTISQLDARQNRISVQQKDGGAGSAGEGSLSMADLKVGSKVKAVVRQTREFGLFVDIGLGRKDALLHVSRLGDKTPDAFQPNDEIEVFIAEVDQENDRVAVSLKEITGEMMSGSRSRRSGSAAGYIPKQNYRIPDLQRWVDRLGDERWLIDDVGIEPLDEWMAKYPGLWRLPEKEVESPMCRRGFNFSGIWETTPAQKVYLPIPLQLRKDDAGEPYIPEKEAIEDLPMIGWDTGIKPEIHIKYRAPPMNDPNWVWMKQEDKTDGTPTPVMSFAEVRAQMKPFVSKLKKKEADEADGDGEDKAEE